MKDEQFYHNKLINEVHEVQQVGWDNIHKAVDRYMFAQKMVHVIMDDGAMVVDYGCGLCTLADYLPSFNYVGIDKLPAMVEGARKRTGINVKVGTAKDVPTCDVVVNLGAWTLKDDMTDIDYEIMVFNEMELISQKADCLIVNGFHLGADYYDPKLFYHDLGKMVNWCTTRGYDWSVYNFERWEFFMVITF